MGTPTTLPANFFEEEDKKKKDKAPKTLPADFFARKESVLAPPPESPQAPETLPPPPAPQRPTPSPAAIAGGMRGVSFAPPPYAKPLVPEGVDLREELRVPFIKHITGKSLTEWVEPLLPKPGAPVKIAPKKLTPGQRMAIMAKAHMPLPPPEELAGREIPALGGMLADSVKLATGLLDFFGSPEGISAAAIATTGPLGAAGVAAFYATEQGIESKRAIEEWALDPRNPEKIQAALMAPGFAFLLAGGAGKAYKGHLEFKAKIKTAWEDFYRKEGMDPVRARDAAEIQVAKGLPPPDVIPAEFVKMVEESQHEAIERITKEMRAKPEPSRLPEPEAKIPEELAPPPTLKPPVIRAEQEVERAQRAQESKAAELHRADLKLQGELPKEIIKVNRAEDLLPIIEEGFASPSIAFRKVSPSAGKIVDLTIVATETISRDTAVGITEYERVWKPLRTKALETETIRLLDDPRVTPENLSTRTNPKVREAYIATRVLLDNMKERINAARESAGLPPITGITEGYFPHVFQGDWTITKQVGKEWQPIETGWLKPSQVEATNAAREYLKANPGTSLKVELNKLHMTGDQATALSRKSYFRLMSRLSKANELFLDPLSGEMIAGPMGAELARERLQGVARPTGKPAKRATFGHVKPRKTDLAGWLEDPKALELLIRGAERYIQMTQLRPEVAKLRERVNTEAPEATRLHRQLDSYIGAAIEGKVDGFSASMNAAWEKTGEALGVAARPAALQRVSRRINEAQSLLKLGFSPVSAFVNLTQTPINSFPVLGAKYTIRGMRRYAEAYRDNFRGKSNPYWDIIEELNIPSQATKIEEAGMRDHFRARLPRSARDVPALVAEAGLEIGLWPFRQAELANRGVAALGAYERAKDGGATHGTAIAEARSVLTRTQFQYGPADAPWVLRQAWTRVPGQFKTFQIKELEYILGLNKQELARFIPALIATTGVVGVPGAMLLDSAADALGIHINGMTPLEYLRIEAGTADDSYLGRLQKLVVMGAPAAAGIDVIRNVGFQEFFSPAMFELRDLVGPTGNDLKNLFAWAPKAIASRVGPTLRGEIETAGELIEGLPSRERDEAFRTFISQLSPAARRVWGIQSSLAKEGDIRDPRTGKLIVGNLSKTERLLMVFGFTPMRVSSLRELERVYVKALMREQDIRNGFVDQLAHLQIQSRRLEESGDVKGATESETRYDYLIDWADRMEVSRGLMASILSRVRTLERTAIERLERRTPRRVGPQEEQEKLLKYADELQPPPEDDTLKPPPEE